MIHIKTSQKKAMAEKYLEQYDEAMIEDLLQFAKDELEGENIKDIDEDLWLGIFQSWSPKDEGEWAFDMVESEIDDAADAAYEQWKDERMER